MGVDERKAAMSASTRLATRCNACGTSFRVQEEQLAASDGYVRCGRCDAVFNARSTLFDLDAPAGMAQAASTSATVNDTEPPLPEVSVSEAANYAPAVGMQEGVKAENLQLDEAEQRDRSATAPADVGPRTSSPAVSATTSLGPSDGLEPAEPTWREGVNSSPAGDPRLEPDWQEPDASRMLELLGTEALPSQAEAGAPIAAPATWNSLRERRPRKPESRLMLAGLSLISALLVLALPVHWAWVEREPLRAQHAELDAWLTDKAALPSTGWRHLDGLQVSSSSLRATPQGGAFQLELIVLNRAAHRLAMPWLDLSLSDSKGQAVLRRSLDPALLGPSQALAPNEQRKLQIVFRIDRPTAVAGYEVGLFHP